MSQKLFITIVAALVCAYVVIRFLHRFLDWPIVPGRGTEHREIGFAAIMKSPDAAK
jgi:hypothetical protein